jgi:nucleoside-triphosphatase THEP1
LALAAVPKCLLMLTSAALSASGRYGAKLAGFESVIHDELDKPEGDVDLFVIDEVVGKMRCFSRAFVEAIENLLNSSVRLLATITMKGGGLITGIKAGSDVEVTAVLAENRDDLPGMLLTPLIVECGVPA